MTPRLFLTSPDGSKRYQLTTDGGYSSPSQARDTDSGQQLVLAATHGPAWSGEPPYPEPDYLGGDSGLAESTIEAAARSARSSTPRGQPTARSSPTACT